MRKIALISDIHGNAVALEAVLQDIDQQTVDEIFVLGDIANREAEPAKCVALVQGFPSVGGNGDQYVIRGYEENQGLEPLPIPTSGNLDWLDEEVRLIERRWTASRLTANDIGYLGTLPDWVIHPIGNDQNMLLCHSTPTDRLVRIFSDSSNQLLYRTYVEPFLNVCIAASGHTHRPFVRYLNGAVIINPGTVGLPIDGRPSASYGMVEIDGENVSATIRRVPYDVSMACDILVKVGYPYAISLGKWLRHGVQPTLHYEPSLGVDLRQS